MNGLERAGRATIRGSHLGGQASTDVTTTASSRSSAHQLKAPAGCSPCSTCKILTAKQDKMLSLRRKQLDVLILVAKQV